MGSLYGLYLGSSGCISHFIPRSSAVAGYSKSNLVRASGADLGTTQKAVWIRDGVRLTPLLNLCH